MMTTSARNNDKVIAEKPNVVHQPGFADTFTGYIVATTFGKVIFPITLSCYNN